MATTYRSPTVIVGSVLHVASEYGRAGINHTGILRKANLSHASLCRLMARLLQAGLVSEEIREGQRVYSITPKGAEYLDKYRQFEQITHTFGLRL